jgi:hypothetical protein
MIALRRDLLNIDVTRRFVKQAGGTQLTLIYSINLPNEIY